MAKPPIPGHDPPNMAPNVADMVCGDDIAQHSVNSVDMVVPNEIATTKSGPTVTLDTARLQKAMIDVKGGVVGSASALVEALSSAL